MSGRIQRVCLTLLAAACVSLALAATAAAAEGSYTEGVLGQPFWLPMLDEGLTIVGGEDEDQTLVLDVDAVTDLSSPTRAGGIIKHYAVGAPHPGMGFTACRVHADFSQAVGVNLTVRFVEDPAENEEYDWRVLTYTGMDDTGAWVFTPPPFSGGHDFMYELVFTLCGKSATGTATIADFTLDWGEWLEDPDGNGGGKDDDDGKDDDGDGAKKPPSGVAYMGGSDGGPGSGGDGTGSGSGGQGVGAAGGGSAAGGGDSGVDTDAPVAAEPPASAACLVTGYPLGACDLGAGTAGGSDGSGSAGGPAPDDGWPDASRVDLAWLAVAFLVVGPLTAAEFSCRRVRRRLRTLVESTPDAPALHGPILS